MIKLIALDVDGCLSDGKIIYNERGELTKEFNVKDGLGIRTWQELGGITAIITGKESTVVTQRARELKIKHVHQGIRDKGKILRDIAEREHISLDEIAAIGDDLNDLKMLTICAKSFCPADAVSHVKERVSHVLQTRGGEGAVREMIEAILESENRMESFLAFWE